MACIRLPLLTVFLVRWCFAEAADAKTSEAIQTLQRELEVEREKSERLQVRFVNSLFPRGTLVSTVHLVQTRLTERDQDEDRENQALFASGAAGDEAAGRSRKETAQVAWF